VHSAVSAPTIAALLRPGMRVALAVGSRGIAGLATIVRALVDALGARGCTVVILPTMGSHGGGTPEGQLGVLATYGVNEAAMGVPIISSMATQVVGVLRFDEAGKCYVADPAGDVPVPVASDAIWCLSSPRAAVWLMFSMLASATISPKPALSTDSRFRPSKT